MEKQKTKLGARVLTDAELKAILPDAESVYELIEMFRNSISKENDDQWKLEQKTNNIGIMGRRGAGKTSILRTFHKNLRDQSKDDDIILPIIVPENLSPGTTLMDVVLGMLKPVAEERNKGQREWPGDCIYSGRNLLEQKYNEVVKQYCYIKKDYRDILIQQFTTEQNYVDKTKEVFNSDTEFIELFNQFIVSLLKDSTETDESPMLFLFIDDIDLSTSRCVDVARALLSYLSNPRIVTFISGDLDTFEEALTLEFLRQEGALTEGVIHEAYYSVSDNNDVQLLQRKKTLAYEYLRKIIPPAYRKSIKYWSLEDRGNYRVEADGQKSLAELLVEVSRNTVEKSYFIYRENDEEKHMGLSFHMLDDTSRGLNNVYNVLLELCDQGVKEADSEKGKETVFLWRLIEVIVDSKPLYTRYKEQLLKQIVMLEQKQVKVNFADAYELLYGKSRTSCLPWERFAIFLFIDFSARLFSIELEKDNYIKLKNEVIWEYLKDETIDGRIAKEWKGLKPWPGHGEMRRNYSSMQMVLFMIMEEGDFFFLLYLIKYIGREEIYKIWREEERRSRSEKELAYVIAYALYRAVWAMNETKESRQGYLVDMYVRMQKLMLTLLSELSLDSQVIYGMPLTDGVAIGGSGMEFWDVCTDLASESYHNIKSYIVESQNGMAEIKQKRLLWAEYESENWVYWFFFQKLLREDRGKNVWFNVKSMMKNAVFSGLIKTIMNQMQGVIERYQVKALNLTNYEEILNGRSEKEKKEWQVIVEIDKNNLWKNQYVKDKVIKYLENERAEYISKMSQGRIIFDTTELLAGAYNELKNCDKGSSGRALVNQLIPKVQKMIFLQASGVIEEGNRFADGKYYLRLEQVLVIQCLLEEFLEIHQRVKCGKREIRQLLMEVGELPLVIHTSTWNSINYELKEKERSFFRAILGDIENGIGNFEIAGNDEYKLHLGQNEEIKKLSEKSSIGGKVKEKWDEMEPTILTKDYIFIFHSYLRYLQANATDAAQGGAQAEGIAQLAQYMLDSEVIADQEIQNEVYEKISKEIDLTEEEFETLF